MNFECFENFCKTSVIAITGGVASGKSAVTLILKQMGYYTVDADELARRVVAPGRECLRKIVDAFGHAVLKDGMLDRKYLRELIFLDSNKRLTLESIVHPAILKEFSGTIRSLPEDTRRPIFYEAALIAEKAKHNSFLEVWCVVCNPETQRKRLLMRPEVSTEMAERIIMAQMPTEIRKKHCDRLIATDGTIADTKTQVIELVKSL